MGLVWDELEEMTRLYRIAREALLEIKNKHGGVCAEFEICTHRGCNDSHAAWEIADLALRRCDGIDNTHNNDIEE